MMDAEKGLDLRLELERGQMKGQRNNLGPTIHSAAAGCYGGSLNVHFLCAMAPAPAHEQGGFAQTVQSMLVLSGQRNGGGE